MDGLSIEDAVKLYMDNRKRLSEIEDDYKARKSEVTEQQDILEAYFKMKMQESGLTKLPTASGTPYVSTVQRFKMIDRDAYIKWAKENNFYDGFSNTLNKTALVDYMTQENAGVPPGLELTQVENVNVRTS